MELLFSIIKYGVGGFFGLIVLIFVLGAIFGKRVNKKWEYEADFLDARGKEFGEFEIELSQIEEEEPDYTLKAQLKLRHSSLTPGADIQVFIEDTLVLEVTAESAGRIYVDTKDLTNEVYDVAEGQQCRVLVRGIEVASAEFHPD